MDLSIFCDSKCPALHVNKPFRFKDHSFYTDGVTFIRAAQQCHHATLSLAQEKSFGPLLSKLFEQADFSETAIFIAFPELPSIAELLRPTCGDTQASTICPECRGTKLSTWENEFNSYKAPCKTCNQIGRIPATTLERGSHFDDSYSDNIAAKFALLPSVTFSAQQGNLVIKFDGGLGIMTTKPLELI